MLGGIERRPKAPEHHWLEDDRSNLAGSEEPRGKRLVAQRLVQSKRERETERLFPFVSPDRLFD